VDTISAGFAVDTISAGFAVDTISAGFATISWAGSTLDATPIEDISSPKSSFEYHGSSVATTGVDCPMLAAVSGIVGSASLSPAVWGKAGTAIPRAAKFLQRGQSASKGESAK